MALWSQLLFKAVIGKRAGEELEIAPSTPIKWKNWKTLNKDGEVLSRKTGYVRDYSRGPYLMSRKSTKIMFPIQKQDRQLRPKEQVFVVLQGVRAKAYPLRIFSHNKSLLQGTDNH